VATAATEALAMASCTKVQHTGETVRFVGGHWIIYKHASLFGVLTVCAAVLYLIQPDSQKQFLLVVLAVLLLLTVLAFVRRWFHRLGTEIVITDKRIIHKTGFISRRTEEMNISKVETGDVSQGIGGRILGYGDVAIIGTGATWEPLRSIAAPLQLRNAIMVG
jgi:uncharacterized membrane protein YdbT with pleckstrin-like domain